jgi:hypothetical protein
MDEQVGLHEGTAHAHDFADAGPYDDSPDAREECGPACGVRRVHFCGQILDMETSQTVTDAAATALRLRIVVAKDFAADVNTAPILEVTPDAEGHFCAQDATHDGVDLPPWGAFVVVVDDADEQNLTTAHVRTATTVQFFDASLTANVNVYATRASTETAWSAAAGQGLAARGVFAGIFLDLQQPPLGPYPGTPEISVKITGPLAVFIAVDDFYFVDTSPLERRTLGPRALTGWNGTALWVDGGWGGYYGNGPAGCQWQWPLGSTVPGVVWVAEITSNCY